MGLTDEISSLSSSVFSTFAALFTGDPVTGESIDSRSDVFYEYWQALLHIPQLLQRLAFKTRTLEAELHEVRCRRR